MWRTRRRLTLSVCLTSWFASIHASCLTTVVYQKACVCVCEWVRVRLCCMTVYVCVYDWVCVWLSVCMTVSGMAPGYAVKTIKMSLLLCSVTFCLFRLYLRPLWSTLIFYYLLLSDYWPSCYMLYKEPTLISSPPPLPELKGQFTCNSSNPQSGFNWILLHFFNIHMIAEKYSCPCMKTVHVSVFWIPCCIYLMWKGLIFPALILKSISTDVMERSDGMTWIFNKMSHEDGKKQSVSGIFWVVCDMYNKIS